MSSLHQGGLRIVMQPVVDLRTGGVQTFEALARLEVRDECLAPDDFIPLLSSADVDLLFRQVLELALDCLQHWDVSGIELGVSVNVDPATLLDQQCSVWVADALHRHRVRADRLRLELLESGPVDTSEQIDTLGRLGGLGVGLAMDDFGVGYSDVARLAALPFDTVKIDHTVVGRLRTEPRSAVAAVAELVKVAAGRGCVVVAEGVENVALAEAARILGCDLAQGFYFARPMRPDAVVDWLGAPPRPGRQDRVTTPLGAFAYHWNLSASGRPHPGTVDDCAISALLAEGSGEQVVRWHAAQHGPQADATAADALAGWLEERVSAG